MTESGAWKRALRRIGTAAAILLLAGSMALASRRVREQAPKLPSYAIPTIAVTVMSLVVLAIPCKRFRRD
jgi:hypothetical protein